MPNSGPIANVIRVLIIEDDQDYIVLLNDLLHDAKRMRFATTSAKSCQEGLTAVQQGTFHVILLDHKLPDGEGLALIPQLRDQAPVVMITSHGDRTLQSRALEAGAVEYLEKGSFTADLLERTCLYAVGLKERRNTPPPMGAAPVPVTPPANGHAPPGIGMLVQELVSLTRESIRAQTEATAEIKELRKELTTGLKELHTELEQGTAKTNNEIQGLAKGRWMLEWASAHPFAAILIFIGAMVALAVFVGALQIIDMTKVGELINLTRG